MSILELKGLLASLAVDDDFVTFIRKGMMAQMSYGVTGENKIRISDITSIQFREASKLSYGYIEFIVPGSMSTVDRIKSGGSLSGSLNSVTWNHKNNEDAKKIKEFIEKKISGKNDAPKASGISAADEIKKYKQLMDEGVITRSEFETKKAELLKL